MTQYYKNTIEIAIAKYRAGAMNAIGLLFDYVKVKFRPDWRITLNPKKVCEELGISNSTFYRSLKKVQQLLGKVIYIRTEKAIPTGENESPISENLRPTGENLSPTHENSSPTREKIDRQTTNKISTCSDTPDVYTNIDQISLSKQSPTPKSKPDRKLPVPPDEREKFLDFAMDRVNELPTRPTLPSKWIAANFDDLYSEFKLSSAPETQEATKDKQFAEWCDLMRAVGKLHRKFESRKTGEWVLVDNCGAERSYEDWSRTYTLEYLRRCVGDR